MSSIIRQTAFVVITHAGLWAYPVTTGGAHNLIAFWAWAFAVAMLLTGIASLFIDKLPSSGRRPAWIKALISLSFIGAVAWLIYHGHFALAGVLGTGSALMLLRLRAERNAATA